MHIEDITMIDIPDTIKYLHPHIHLSADYFFIQGIVFLRIISRGYDFRTIEHIKDFGRNYNKKMMLDGIRKCKYVPCTGPEGYQVEHG